MMRPLAVLLCAVGYAAAIGCGSVGEPLYPAVNIPSTVTDLAAIERGNKIDVTFTIPPKTTEGLTLKAIGSIELRVGPNTTSPFQTNQWASGAKRADVATPAGPGPVPLVRVPAQEFIGKDVIVAVRVSNAKGRFSNWSNLAQLKVEQPLTQPTDVKAVAAPQGVSVTWTDPGVTQFRIYRKAGEEKAPSLLASADQPNYVDATAEYGKAYEYYVEGFHDKAVTDVAGPASITPKDTFPPAVPAGLSASAGIGAIELAWERNTETDFKEYRVYRAEGDGQFVQIAEGLEAPTYSDHNVESGKRYRYRIVAVDQTGNASDPSNPVEATVP